MIGGVVIASRLVSVLDIVMAVLVDVVIVAVIANKNQGSCSWSSGATASTAAATASTPQDSVSLQSLREDPSLL
jgi:hypothetical protein